ncbi:MAG TPA: class I SAM-dependent methyltransferase, partial [Candidatus Cybelea sp.]|nr:class I SAM-dependent methyltransferase [Candidatus Cybelea sp.]
MTAKSTFIDPAIQEYIIATVVRENPVLRRLREETARHPHARMAIGPEQGELMRLLARTIAARRYLEIGVFTGYSSLAMALALPPDGYVLACDVSEEYTSVARRYWREAGVERKISLRLAPAVETLDALLAEGRRASFDFAFIDADKENYDRYYERALELLRPGGLIAVDNVLWHGRVMDASAQDADTKAIRSFNEKLHGDER